MLERLALLVESGRLPQAMLFTGDEGIGKKPAAMRVLASLFCAAGERPCMKCTACRQAFGGIHPDLVVLEPNEKGAIPIGSAREPGTVRWLIERLSRRALTGRYGVLINGIDRISREGEIALLKTIEEPQSGSCIIMLASNKSEILPTILSRSMEVSFSPLKEAEVFDILGRLDAGEFDRDTVARFSGGSVRRALFIADKELFSAVLDICREVSGYVNSGGILHLDLGSIAKKIDTGTLLSIMISIYRDMLLSAIGGKAPAQILEPCAVHETENIRRVLKILLDLTMRETYNINVRNSLKGMLYGMERGAGRGIHSPAVISPIAFSPELRGGDR